MNEQWQQWQQKIDALNQRERIILLVTLVVVVIVVCQVLLIDPLMADRKRAKTELQAVKETLQRQQNEIRIISAQLAAGVNRHKEAQRDQLTREVADLDKQIQASVVAMIPPKLMPEVLENILQQNKELKLVSLENKPVVSVLEDVDKPPANSPRAVVKKTDDDVHPKQGLYNHGFVLTLSGNYMAAIRYFEQLSKLPWRFYWDSLTYQVDTYPNATITLEVHTVSMSEDWIGV